MKRIGWACCLLLILLPEPVFATHLKGAIDVGAGGGYSDNLNNPVSSAQKEGSAFGMTWVTLNVSQDVFSKEKLVLSGGYNGTYYASFNDLTVNGFTIAGELFHPVTKAVSLQAMPRIGIRTYGDSDRDSKVYEISIAAKGQIHPRFALRTGYRFMRNAAEQSVFSYRSNRLSLGGEIKVLRRAFLTLGYAAEFSQTPFYQSAAGASGGIPSTTFGANQVVMKADTTAHTFSARWDQDVTDEVFILLDYAYSYVQRGIGDYRNHLVSGEIGTHF